jgi:UDP-N-acetyl-D-galactosamine dehydrogenase
MRYNKISIIGLGYVGLPLAVALSKHYKVIGFDLNKKRIKSLHSGHDYNLDIEKKKILKNKFLPTYFEKNLIDSDIFIITVPTPITKKNKPDLKDLKNACLIVGKYLKKNSIVIYESTVYPGLTEEVCKPILETISGLKSPYDFGIGYSPERVNPGDKKHTLEKISKIVSGQNNRIRNQIYFLYKKIIKKRVIKASSIKVAESAKVIENIQRDLNIAFANELSLIFHKIKVNTNEVIELASTKWNFAKYKPGLVGGHCISVDPYYLTHKSTLCGYKPKFILSGRNINNNMPNYIVNNIKKIMKLKKKKKINFFGITFKENCPDFRNSLSLKIIEALKKNYQVFVHDPYYENKKIHNIKIKKFKQIKKNSINVISVSHNFYIKNKKKLISNFFEKESVIFDIKSIFSQKDISKYNLNTWQL